MLEDMQDMLFSATSRNTAWVESKSILFLRDKVLYECKAAWRIVLQENQQIGSSHLPEQAEELTQGELKGNQELSFVQ